MSDFMVKTNNLDQIAGRLSTASNKVDKLADEARSIILNTRASLSTRLVEYAKATIIHSSVSNCASDLKNLSNALDEAASIYEKYEKKLMGEWTILDEIVDQIRDFFPDFDIKLFGEMFSYEEDGNGGFWNSEGSVITIGSIITNKIFGIDVTKTIEGKVLGYETDTKAGMKWKPEEGEANMSANGSIKGYLFGYESETSTDFGKLKKGITIGEVGTTGSIGLSILDDGKFRPSLFGKLEGSAAVLKGEAGGQIGSDQNNIHINADGTLLGAEADIEVGLGVIEVVDEKTGQKSTEFGVKGEVSAEAYLAEGKVQGGFSVFGIDINVGISGKAGGAGVEAGGSITTGGVSGEIGAGLGLGAGLEISIDWSDFKWPW